MNPQVKKLWVEALNSGEYVQGEGMLRTSAGKFCCLGVLCDLHAKHVKPLWEQFDGDWYYGDDVYRSSSDLPKTVYEWAGLGGADGANPRVVIASSCGAMTLITQNDTQKATFAEIAKAIDEQL